MASSWSSSPDYAGFGQRAAAFAIDALVALVVCVPPMVVLRSWGLLLPVALVAAVIGFWRYYGATPGKHALALKIVDAASGTRPRTGRLVLRFLGYFVSALPFTLGFLWIAVDRRKQGWHDKIAGTVVIHSED